jgi:hypothetical protein
MAERRGSKEKRGPVEIYDSGRQWHCYVCGAGGGAEAFGRVRLSDYRPTVMEPTPYLPVEEVRACWESCRPAGVEDLSERGIDPAAVVADDMARGSVTLQRKWWGSWPYTMVLWNGAGEPRGLHGRKVAKGGEGRKGHFPTGFRSEALFLATVNAVGAMAIGDPVPLGFAVEGATDWLRMGAAVRREGWGVWGCVSGSWGYLKPEWAQEWVVCVDDDPAGSRARVTSDGYVTKVLRALGGAWVFRGDVCDVMGGGMTVVDIIRKAEWRVS